MYKYAITAIIITAIISCEGSSTPYQPYHPPDLSISNPLTCISRLESGNGCQGLYKCNVNVDCFPVRCAMGNNGVCLKGDNEEQGYCFYGFKHQ